MVLDTNEMFDFTLVILYFALILIIALGWKRKRISSSDEYFLSNRNLSWYSVALSSIATNIQGYQFLGMMGSAYLFGLAQANLEINAVQGILIAVFIFIPLFFKHKITTITEFVKIRLGNKVALFYSLSNIFLFSTITIGAALFWGAYAADMVFAEQLAFISENRIYRIATLIIILGVFSAIYTYIGGLSAVVKTDIIQFFIIILSGALICITSINELGGWDQLYIKTPEKMSLHLHKNHPTLPWTHLFGLFLLNINYWCANQTIMQRAIAAKNIYHAQTGLMVGGLIKYFMAVIIIIPGIALYGILGDGLSEPDLAFPYLVKMYLPVGIKGIVLCGLFASLMSTIDSTFNSLATLWSNDIYSNYINIEATDLEKVKSGRKAIIISLFSSLITGFLLLYLKFDNPDSAFTHTLNNLRYYINCGIVILIVSGLFLIKPPNKLILIGFILSIPINIIIENLFTEMNYFVRAFFVIISGIMLTIPLNYKYIGNLDNFIFSSSNKTTFLGWILLISLILIHIIFH
tara:strand:+ start:1848 stop:3410 length:1563 start_codon:yes stop_codon:yes gene_type:complete